MRLVALALALLLAVPAAAQLDAEARAARTEPLLDLLAETETPQAAAPIVDAIWRAWSLGPDAAATERLEAGRARIRAYDFAGALEILTPLAEAHPDFAEARNQKAFAHFLREEYDEALDDIARVLALEPRHFGALAGKATILMRQGRIRLGQKTLREALEINPWMPERAMLIPEPPSEEI